MLDLGAIYCWIFNHVYILYIYIYICIYIIVSVVWNTVFWKPIYQIIYIYIYIYIYVYIFIYYIHIFIYIFMNEFFSLHLCIFCLFKCQLNNIKTLVLHEFISHGFPTMFIVKNRQVYWNHFYRFSLSENILSTIF